MCSKPKFEIKLVKVLRKQGYKWSNAHSIVTQNISYSDDAAYWFRYIDTCVIVNAWDTMPQALNGFDFDGDLLFTTNNDVLLRTHDQLPALNCVQYNAEKSIVDDEDIIKANKLGFGSKIGSITNRITSMTSLMINFEPGSKEYETLKYRTQCGQAQQQAEIDKAKGILPTPMPKSWYIMSENKINEGDSEEEILKKQLYQRICADKKPYFFCHNYLSLRKEYNDYINRINEKSIPMFGMSYEELRKKEEKTEKEASFIEYADKNIPLDMSPSVMNKICWSIEDQLDNIQMPLTETFDSSMIKSGHKYSICTYKEIEKIYKAYKKKVGALAKRYKSEFYEEPEESFDSKEQIQEWFAEKCMEICSNQYELCDILIDICYRGRNDKEPVWTLCGDIIIENLLKNNNDNMYYPVKVDDNEEFECCGSKFVMRKIKNGGDN